MPVDAVVIEKNIYWFYNVRDETRVIVHDMLLMEYILYIVILMMIIFANL